MIRPCVLLLALALALAVAACADTGDEGFVVRNNLAPAAGACTFMASTSSPFLSRGTLSTRSRSAYLLTPLIQSRITAAMGQEAIRTVSLMGAKVDLAIGPITVEDAAGNVTFSCAAEGANQCFGEAERATLASAGTTKFRQPFSAPLPPNGGLSSAVFDLVPTAVVNEIGRKAGAIPAGGRMSALVLATATIYGRLGGDDVDGLPFDYPVTVCTDCVVNHLGPCGGVKTSFMPRPGNPCNAFQDGVIDCCSNGAELVCPAVGTLP
jgi:hypothetical protein